MSAGPARAPRGAGRWPRQPAAIVARPTLPFLSLLAVALLAAPAPAQLPWLSPLPVWSPADSLAVRSCQFELTRSGDGRTGWTADRLTVEGRLPFGRRACVVLRLPYLRSDHGALSPAARWPGILGPGAEAGWPHEAVTAGFGQAELGLAGPLALPLLGAVSGALMAGLPLGESQAYPWSSAGLSARVGVTRWFGLRPDWWLGVGGGAVTHTGPGRDEFAATAFPDGWTLALSAEREARTWGARLAWEAQSRGGREAQELSAGLWVPWQGDSRLGLRVAREITGAADRLAAWTVGLTCRLTARPPAVAAAGATAPSSAGR